MTCKPNCPCGQNPEQRPVPASAEGDERAKFEAWWGTQSSGFKPDAWVAWQARAALSNVQPKGTEK